jgi:putative CocE/NonD family hydrolase
LYRCMCASLILCSVGTTSSVAMSDSYPDSIRTSQYVTVRDGTRLAIDIHRPATQGKPVDTPLPVLLEATIDFRRPLFPAFMTQILKQGYVVALLEVRGQGASFGRTTPMRMETGEDYWDMYDVIQWLAKQPWSDGKIGMIGCSNRGMLQWRAATAMPPNLKAIAPTAAPIDWTMMGTINGVATRWGKGHDPIPYDPILTEPTPVDEDHDRVLAHRAMMEHTLRGTDSRPFRDTPVAVLGVDVLPTHWWNLLPNFTMSKLPVFQYSGWRDFFPEQSLALYRNLARLKVPQKLIIGPWYHCEWYNSDLTDAAAETGRWYDYWLKGKDNGVMREPPIRYYVMGAPTGQEWKSADRWPLPKERRQNYFLGDHESLSKRPSSAPPDHYTVNYTGSASKLATRWNGDMVVAAFNPKRALQHPELTPIPTSDLDQGSLTYTSAPLTTDSELTGFPVVSLYVSSTAKDQDFFAYLEEVDSDGRSTLLTEGMMRAATRATRDPPFDNEGLPWHPDYNTDQKELEPGVPTKLDFALYPFSNNVRKGHRLRVTVNSFDDGWFSPQIEPAPVVSVYHDAQHPSSISVPFIAR